MSERLDDAGVEIDTLWVAVASLERIEELLIEIRDRLPQPGIRSTPSAPQPNTGVK